MQLTEAQVKQAIGDLYLDTWGAMQDKLRAAQVQAALVARVQELESKAAEVAKSPSVCESG